MKKTLYTLFFIVIIFKAEASYLLIPMDEVQKDHLKSYGIAYWVLAKDVKIDWLLNYRGGSFVLPHVPLFENECRIRGVSYEILPDAKYNSIVGGICSPDANMDVMKLEKPPKMAVYSPKNKQPWDDAVTLVLTYAEIPYDIVYDEEIMSGILPKYDWLHLHHEDFTGQYGKFYRSYSGHEWYREYVRSNEATATKLGFDKVSHLKLAVAKKIREFVAGGGFMFAMCAATDTYDIALSADGTDICEKMFDGDPIDPDAQKKLDFNNTFAFHKFFLETNPFEYEFSSIDASAGRNIPQPIDFFTLFEFSAKWDPVPTMLTQCHQKTIKGFMGQTTAFKKEVVKPNVLVMGENKAGNEARYIHGSFGMGTWTFYGGHDPEDYQHEVGSPPTDLSLHPNSAGYRLILNNVLFPAAKKKKQKT